MSHYAAFSKSLETLKQLEELQSPGLIERTVTEWACPMILVKKKNNK